MEALIPKRIGLYDGTFYIKPLENISNLNSSSTKVNVEGVVTEIKPSRAVKLKSGGASEVCTVVLKDGSGQIDLSLWDLQIKQVKVGSKIAVENGYVSTYKGTNALNVGKFGRLNVISY
jgi:replication factor A1